MSWDKSEFLELAKCPCGKGHIKRTYWRRDDDWNRMEDGYYNFDITCFNCLKEYTNKYEPNFAKYESEKQLVFERKNLLFTLNKAEERILYLCKEIYNCNLIFEEKGLDEIPIVLANHIKMCCMLLATTYCSYFIKDKRNQSLYYEDFRNLSNEEKEIIEKQIPYLKLMRDKTIAHIDKISENEMKKQIDEKIITTLNDYLEIGKILFQVESQELFDIQLYDSEIKLFYQAGWECHRFILKIKG